MLGGALQTYAAALIVVGASLALGAGVLAASGARKWSWTAPAIGLAAATMIAWWTVRLPGHGWTALAALAVAAVGAGAYGLPRLHGIRPAFVRGAPTFLIALAAVSIPFAIEGRFGILGTGFNVDMSQHLFAASWLADPSGSAPGLFEQGYPLGPHALAVSTGEVGDELATSFSGVTIAAPVIAAVTALAALGSLPRWRATIAAALTAFAYLTASYLAQGSFKELFEVVFLLGFAVWLGSLHAPAAGWGGLLAGLPGAVLGGGALYAYSGPGLAWLGGALAVWIAVEVVRRRREATALARRALPALALAAVALLALAAPELDRLVDFGGSVGTVSDRAQGGSGAELRAERGDAGAEAGEGPRFNDDLGNLFGQVSPIEVLGVWPSGDFRVAPGDGAAPAALFYLGALLGLIALALGIVLAVGRGERTLLAAFAAAIAIWIAARIGSTPYTAAKALQMMAPLVMLIAARGMLAPSSSRQHPDWARSLRVAIGVAFITAAAGSSGLALGNAPVGPREYSPGAFALSERFAGEPTLLLAPQEILAEQHGREFYGWELREADPACVAVAAARVPGRPPSGIRFVLTVAGEESPPFEALEREASVDGVTLWTAPPASTRATTILPEPGSTDCGLEPGRTDRKVAEK